jgi:hypothetical protein
MEKEQPQAHDRVQITKAVYDGLEYIRRSGATNMLDRPMVLSLAREWDFIETADWIESVDTGAYGRLILLGPDVIGDESLDEKLDRMDRVVRRGTEGVLGRQGIVNCQDSGG